MSQTTVDSVVILKQADSVLVVKKDTAIPISVGLPQSYLQLLRKHPFFNFFASPIIHTSSEREFKGQEHLFYLLVGLAFLLALVKAAYSKYFGNMITVSFTPSLKHKQLREQLMQSPLPSFFLNMIFVLVMGLYITFLVQNSSGWRGQFGFWLLLIYCVAIILAIYLVKLIVLKFVGWIFGISQATDLYIFIVFLVNKLMGIFFLPLITVMAFAPKTWWQVLPTFSYILLGGFLIYRYVVAFAPVRRELKVSQFHFFMYLCAFEILPMVLIYREFSEYFN